MRIVTAKTGPAFSEPRSLVERLERSVEALSHRLWTDAELEDVHMQIEQHSNRVWLTAKGWEASR